MGYHLQKIKKGEVGEFSKIVEEYEELCDAYTQNCKVLQICELSDLIGAIECYCVNKFNLTLEDLIDFSRKTQIAFKTGERK